MIVPIIAAAVVAVGAVVAAAIESGNQSSRDKKATRRLNDTAKAYEAYRPEALNARVNALNQALQMFKGPANSLSNVYGEGFGVDVPTASNPFRPGSDMHPNPEDGLTDKQRGKAQAVASYNAGAETRFQSAFGKPGGHGFGIFDPGYVSPGDAREAQGLPRVDLMPITDEQRRDNYASAFGPPASAFGAPQPPAPPQNPMLPSSFFNRASAGRV